MAQYTVQKNQNIYDIALLLYGSIEGLYDLLISNKDLSMDTDIKAGMVLEYHDYYTTNDDVLNSFAENGYTPANGERNVYAKSVNAKPIFQIEVDSSLESISLAIHGSGNAIIDWGDDSDLENVVLSDENIDHDFDDIVDETRIIRIYGDLAIDSIDASDFADGLYVISQASVGKFVCESIEFDINSLGMMDGLSELTLAYMALDDLSPIYDIPFTLLDLYGAHIDPDVIDSYLTYIVNNYGDHKPCSVKLSVEPGTEGMNAIQTIIGTSAWNVGSKWIFNINGTIYTA